MLNWLIEKRGNKSQYIVAHEIGISQSHYASIETEVRRPSVSVAKRIGAVLGFDWTKFFEEEHEKASGE